MPTYRLLGRSGLRVSPMCLGTMSFGTEWGWGAPEETAFAILDAYFAWGGNFLDTADLYTNGTSELILGRFLEERGLRDKAVLSTKFSFNASPGDPNAGGNARKNIHRALEGSLRRLRTDFIDLYWLHSWDGLTPVDEVMRALNELVMSGKVRYLGVSNVPAWWLGRAQTLAEWRGYEPFCALQVEYSLLERNIEREHVPAARELGLGICPWSPLASGMLTGKYRPEGGLQGEGRLQKIKDSGNPGFDKLFTERNWGIVEELVEVAREAGRPPAQVALNWLDRQPGVTSTLVAATRVKQLEENLTALDFELPPEALQRLSAASRPETVYPYHFFEPTMRAMITGGTEVLPGC